MKRIHVKDIIEKVANMCKDANYNLGDDVMNAFHEALKTEKSEVGKDVLNQLIENAELAKTEQVPMCQDTGVSVFIVELGQDCHIVGGKLTDAIHEGVRIGSREGFLRNSIIDHPLTRKNTGDNAPAVIHVELEEGDQLKIHMTAKGGGSENMSALKMLKPSDGIEGVKSFILDTVRKAGPNACPPMIVGVGIGGSFEKSAYLAKKSLFRPIGERSPHEDIAALELELARECNRLGIGPQGMGGNTTALDVKIDIYPCHIASLPVAVNINCHASRHKEVIF
jgi:fumarate hydratase subunit alpha